MRPKPTRVAVLIEEEEVFVMAVRSAFVPED